MRSGAVLLLLLAQGAAQPAPSPLGAAATASKTEFFKARDKLMAFWCANGQHAESAPCKASALIQKVRAEKDTEKKKKMLADRSAEQKALTPEARKDAKAAGAAMYTAFCAENKDSAECASPMVRAMYAPSSKGTGVPKSTGISKRTVVPKPKTVPA